jgi:hypothetical protein
MDDFLKAHKRATVDATLFMTADLRTRARSEGWADDVVNKLRVVRKDGEFSVRFPASVGDASWIHEYGDEEHTPTGTLRKYDTTGGDSNHFYAERLFKHLEED